MTAPRPQCEAHADLVATLATASERARQLERERDEATGALLRLEARVEAGFRDMDKRVVGIKITMARWGGIFAAVAAAPLAVQFVQWIIRAAEAAP